MIDVKVGDTVWVDPRNGGVFPATVTKVARIWITVGTGRGEWKFRLDDQRDNQDFPSRFYTEQQWAERRKAVDTATYLREQGIDLRHDSPWKGREAELADVLRNAGRG